MRAKELIWRIPLGLLGGLAALYAFPTENLWIFGLLVPLLTISAVLGAGFWTATLIGFLAGLTFYISHIEWISLYLGPVPLIALATLQALFFAPALGIIAVVYRRLRVKKMPIWVISLSFASIWTLREWISTNFPYGGFPWSRLSMTAAYSPFANWVFWGGLSLLTFVMAFLAAWVALIIRDSRKLKLRKLFPLAIVASFFIAIPVFTPLNIATTEQKAITVAAVQGNAKAGLFSREPQGAILQNHLDATYDSLDGEVIDLLVWPENASDIDPLRDANARKQIEELATAIGAPFVFGTITARGSEVFNTTILWEPGVGPRDYYDKKRPVPFAEYVPDRPFWRALAPELIDMVPRGFSFGTRDGIYEIDNYLAGTLICFEIAEDDIPRELAQAGAGIILSQTNNADFGYSDETWQQSAIAKLRAIETGRTVVNISTVGHSAIYNYDGTVLDELEWYTADAMVKQVAIRSGITPAVALGGWFDLLNALLAISAISYAVTARSRS